MHSIVPQSSLTTAVIPAPMRRPSVLTVGEALVAASSGATSRIRDWQAENLEEHFQRSLDDIAAFESGEFDAFGLGQLWASVARADGSVDDLGLVSCRVVTNAGVNFIVDAFQGITALTDLRYHGVGTGTTAEAASQTALVTELTTQYATANTRPTGTAGEVSGTPNAYETTATITVSATVALTEHGIFSRAATGGGTLLDRSVFAAVNLAASESMQVTYQLTLPSGS